MSIVSSNFNLTFGANQLLRLDRELGTTSLRLSTGSKVNNAGDNPTGIMVLSEFSAQISGIRTATSNAEQTDSLLKTADGLLSEIRDILLEMRDTALVAANDATLTLADYANLDSAYQAFLTDIDAKANSGEYNNTVLLDGTYATPGKSAHIGPNPGDSIAIIIASALTTDLGGGSLVGTDVTSAGNAGAAVTAIDTALDDLNANQASVGATMTRVEDAINGLGTQEINMTAAYSSISDADMASEIAYFAKLQILSDSTTAVMAQANNTSQRVIGILDKLNS